MFEHSVCFPSVEDIAWMALGGDMEAAIRQLAEDKQENK
jgi:hypothetical protein